MEPLRDLELLAPAGGPESIPAAVRCGADAVYLGQKGFSARRSAHNFDRDELSAAVRYCHERGVRVYQTLNTLALDEELPAVARCIETAAECGVDALIVQDLGVAALAGQVCPDMRLHASTQMTVHTPDGAKQAAELGFARVVLARELSLAEIEEVHRACGIELEVFVHGALCMSVSGQCLLSAMLGGRSGNRGQCAQPCRLPFSSTDKPAKDLSLKDLCAVELLDGLGQAGVTSLKIEGRMKRPEYVAAAVSSYRRALSGEPTDIETLRAVFSRGGFTNGYLKGELSPGMFGFRGKEDVTAAAGVFKSLENLYHKETPRVGVSFRLTARQGEPVLLNAADGDGNQAAASGEPPQRAITRPTGEEDIRRLLGKLGGTPFYLSELHTRLDDGLMIPAAALNALRRECCEKLLEQRGAPRAKSVHAMEPLPAIRREREDKAPALYARFARAEQLPGELAGVQVVILPYREASRALETNGFLKENCVLELPRAMFGREEKLKQELSSLYNQGFRRVMAHNIAQLSTARELGFEVLGGFGLNAFNSLAARELAKLGAKELILSLELTLSQAERIASPGKKGLVSYGYLPLMVTRNCPVKNQKSCRECAGASYLTDRKGERFRVACSEGYAELLNSVPLYMADRMRELSFCDFTVLYFTFEDKARCEQILRTYTAGKGAKPERFTRGLFYRGVTGS